MRKISVIFICTLLLLAACTSKEEKEVSEKASQTEETKGNKI